ncbi:MAG: fadK 1 [Frankiales bacterium]|nr:fadK 1 [Frankiales bacterium]
MRHTARVTTQTRGAHTRTTDSPGTLAEAVVRGAAQHGDTRVLCISDERPADTDLRTLVAQAERLAGAFQDLGVEPGDVVAVQLPSWYDCLVAQTAVLLAGAVLLPVVPVYGPAELSFILRQSRATAYVLPGTSRGRDFPAMLPQLGDLPDLKVRIVVGEQAPEGALTWAEVTGALARPRTVHPQDPGDLALLVYTSGTTAEPKGVQHSHASLLAELFSPVLTRGNGPEAKQLAVFPSGHVAALLGVLRILIHGTSTVVMDTFDMPLAARLIDEHGVTAGVGAPVHLAALLDEQQRGNATLASLQEYMVGAASVPPSLVHRADEHGVRAYRCYGSSEHPTDSSGVPEDPLDKRATTDGRLIGSNRVRLVDDDGQDVPAGGEGEIVTLGPELFLGYRDEELNAASFLPGGWFRTGDVGRLDEDGFLTITDRKKDIIVRGGENISSKAVEDLLATHPRVAEAAAVGAPDPRLGERVVVFVVLRDGGTLDLDEVRAHFAAAGVARQMTPERVEVVATLPRTAAGKVQKFALRAGLPQPG